jgi:hypothetical protein
VEEACILEAMK